MRPRRVYERAAPPGANVGLRRENPLFEVAKGKAMSALSACFDFLALNLALVLTSLLVVTVPMAVNAAAIALDRWRAENEDRVLREFLSALRSRPPLRTTLAVGAPLAVMVIATEEVHYFARGGSSVDCVCLGFGAAALVIAMGAIGYVVVLSSRNPSASIPDLWSLCVRLALENFFVTGPLFILEIAGAVLLGMADPALVLIGLPVVLLYVVRLTAQLGLRRAERRASE